jgi:thioredoxin 1
MAEGLGRPLVACLCAQWCGACREYRPVFEAIAARFADAADFAWIDIEDESDALGDPDIENFPTLLVVNDGAAVFYGAVTPQPHTAERLVRGALAGELVALGPEAAELAERAVRIARRR